MYGIQHEHLNMTHSPALNCEKSRHPPATDSALFAQQYHPLQDLSHATHLCLQKAYTVGFAVPGTRTECCGQVLLFMSTLPCTGEADSVNTIQPAMTVFCCLVFYVISSHICLVQTAYHCASKQEGPEEQLT